MGSLLESPSSFQLSECLFADDAVRLGQICLLQLRGHYRVWFDSWHPKTKLPVAGANLTTDNVAPLE